MGLSAKGNCVEKVPPEEGGGVGGGEEGGCVDPELVDDAPPQDTQMSKLRKQESQILWGEGLWKTLFIFLDSISARNDSTLHDVLFGDQVRK